MTSLIALISSGKGTWGHVASIIKQGSWDKVYLICNEFSYENYKVDNQSVIKLKIDEKKPQESTDKLAKFFKKEIKDLEVGLNLSSGDGMEHMIVLSSVLKAGLGLRLMYSDYEGLKELKIFNDVLMM